MFQYAEAIKDAGCDSLLFVIEADEAIVEEMGIEIGMPKMHLHAFMRGWKKLVAARSTRPR